MLLAHHYPTGRTSVARCSVLSSRQTSLSLHPRPLPSPSFQTWAKPLAYSWQQELEEELEELTARLLRVDFRSHKTVKTSNCRMHTTPHPQHEEGCAAPASPLHPIPK